MLLVYIRVLQTSKCVSTILEESGKLPNQINDTNLLGSTPVLTREVPSSTRSFLFCTGLSSSMTISFFCFRGRRKNWTASIYVYAGVSTTAVCLLSDFGTPCPFRLGKLLIEAGFTRRPTYQVGVATSVFSWLTHRLLFCYIAVRQWLMSNDITPYRVYRSVDAPHVPCVVRQTTWNACIRHVMRVKVCMITCRPTRTWKSRALLHGGCQCGEKKQPVLGTNRPNYGPEKWPLLLRGTILK